MDLKLDTTGEYLQIGKSKKKKKTTISYNKEAEELFYKNAFLFYDNADNILKNDKMKYAPVNVKNGLAYTGTSGFKDATLGVYIEWWKSELCDNTKDNNGTEALMWLISGSPLSRSNSCGSVYRDGHVEYHFVKNFSKTFSSF